MRVFLLTLMAVVLTWNLAGQNQGFFLKNQEKTSVFHYWLISRPASLAAKNVVQDLPKARGGRQSLAPGEKLPVTLGPGEILVGVFLPWKEELNYQSPLRVGFVLPSEVPPGQTVLLSAKNFSGFNGPREITVTLQDLEIPAPQFALDGEGGDWAKVSPLAEFAPDFRPLARGLKGATWVPGGLPGDLSLPVFTQISGSSFDKGLWFYFMANQDGASKNSWSINLRYSSPQGGTRVVEIPVGKEQEEVRFWSSPQSAPRDIGRSWRQGRGIEVWIPSGRLSQEEVQELRSSSVDFSQVVEFNGVTWDLYYTSFTLQELP